MKRKKGDAKVILIVILLSCFGFTRPAKHLKIKAEIKNSNDSSFFLVISDIHLNLCRTSTDMGGDTDPGLWMSTKTELIKLLDKNPEFVVFTGDLPAHHGDVKKTCDVDAKPLDEYRRNDYDTILTNIYQVLKGRNIPFFFVPGNNDLISGDYGRFTQNNKNVFTDVRVMYKYPGLNIDINKNQYPCFDSINSKDCYYSASIDNGLRLIVLNSNLFSSDNRGNYSVEEGLQELDWMRSELQKAKDQHQKVYLITHIPPGKNAVNSTLWKKTLENNFMTITNYYNNTIAGIIYGHVHTDQFRFLYNKAGDSITQVAFSCPGITSYKHGNNPGIKKFFFNKKSNAITDVYTYYLDNDKPGSSWQVYAYSKIFECKSGDNFTAELINKAGKNLSALSHRERAIYFMRRNADKGSEDYPDAEEMQVKWE